MKNKYILLFLFGFFGIHASAQTLAQAKILYEKGQYEQAKPVFKKFVKSHPAAAASSTLLTKRRSWCSAVPSPPAAQKLRLALGKRRAGGRRGIEGAPEAELIT